MHSAPSDTTDVLLREDHEDVAVLVLNRPRAANALSDELLKALATAVASLRDDRNARAVVIAATGKIFCAGHDLKEMTAHRNDPDRGRAYFERSFRTSAELMRNLAQLPQPVIAAVQGVATAAGCQLVASCDLVVASRAASFCLPGVDIGLYCSAPAVPVARKIAPGHAIEMLMTGEPIAAERAMQIGLVNRIVEKGRERAEAMSLARAVASKSLHVQKLGKQAFYRQREMDLGDAYAYTAKVMAENMLAHDAEEGIGAFVEKRKPKWEDR